MSTLQRITNFSVDELVEVLKINNFEDVGEIIKDNDRIITGSVFLSTPDYLIKKWNLGPDLTKRFIDCQKHFKQSPDQIILSEALNVVPLKCNNRVIKLGNKVMDSQIPLAGRKSVEGGPQPKNNFSPSMPVKNAMVTNSQNPEDIQNSTKNELKLAESPKFPKRNVMEPTNKPSPPMSPNLKRSVAIQSSLPANLHPGASTNFPKKEIVNASFQPPLHSPSPAMPSILQRTSVISSPTKHNEHLTESPKLPKKRNAGSDLRNSSVISSNYAEISEEDPTSDFSPPNNLLSRLKSNQRWGSSNSLLGRSSPLLEKKDTIDHIYDVPRPVSTSILYTDDRSFTEDDEPDNIYIEVDENFKYNSPPKTPEPIDENIKVVQNENDLPRPPLSMTRTPPSSEEVDSEKEEGSPIYDTVIFNPCKFYRNVNRKGAALLLKNLEDGAFLFRPSTKKENAYSITIKHTVKPFFHLGIRRKDNKLIIDSPVDEAYESPEFQNMSEIVEYFSSNLLPLRYIKDNGDTAECSIYLNPVLDRY